jgi:hypothetical protein
MPTALSGKYELVTSARTRRRRRLQSSRKAKYVLWVKPVKQARAVLPAYPKSPSRLKVYPFADRYILCGRYGSGSLLSLVASGSL